MQPEKAVAVCFTATRIQLVLQIDQGNLDGMRGLASTNAVYIEPYSSLDKTEPVVLQLQ